MSKGKENKINELPLIALRGIVMFPNSLINFEVGRNKTIVALEKAISDNSIVFLTAQKDEKVEDPTLDDIFSFGTIARIKQLFKIQGNAVRVIAEGLERGIIQNIIQEQPFITVNVSDVSTKEVVSSDEEIIARMRTIKQLFEEYVALKGNFSPQIIMEVILNENPSRFTDLIFASIACELSQKQKMLEETDTYKRLEFTLIFLTKELSILNIQKEIAIKTKANIDKQQREYYLREQMKVIQTELGEKDLIAAEIKEYEDRMKNLELPEPAIVKLDKELKRLSRSGASADASNIRDYIEWILDLPWNNKTTENKSLQDAERILNRDHYGLEKIKERMVEFLAVRQMAPKGNSPIICLVSTPGVGKTSIAKSIAEALNRKYIRMSLGGVRDEADIRGHRRTYLGSIPGRIIYSMKQAGVTNPLILLDEIDKMGKDIKGDPSSALLEILDLEQNNSFRDHYIEIPYDISDVLFLCTANSIENIPYPLIDRLEIITLSSYTESEKFNIASKYLVTKQFNKHGLTDTSIKINDEAIFDIIKYYCKEAGVRQLERFIGEICRKTVKELMMSEKKSIMIGSDNLSDFLGCKKYIIDKINEQAEVGIVRGLAWTSLGGDTLSIEVNVVKGTGKFELTGNMGDVMKESAQAAVSYIRSRYKEFNLSKNFYKENDIHIHIPEGATPKDGPICGNNNGIGNDISINK